MGSGLAQCHITTAQPRMHDSANDQTATAAKPGSEEKAHQKEIETEEQEDEMTDETLHKQQEQLEQIGRAHV